MRLDVCKYCGKRGVYRVAKGKIVVTVAGRYRHKCRYCKRLQ